MRRYAFVMLCLAANAPPPRTPVAAQAVSPREVRYDGKLSGWIMPPPRSTDGATPSDAPLRVVYSDNQVHVAPAGEEFFTAYRIKLLKPEALPAGNIAVTWSPDVGTATVHYLRIIRDGQVIDVLAANKFQVIQREGGLEQSMLNGQLTATLQAPGLQVGDELEFAATITRRDAALRDHSAGALQLPVLGMPGAFRFVLVWPEGRKLGWRASSDLSAQTPQAANGANTLAYELRDPIGVIPTEGAPARFNVRRLVEYSDFASWTEVSNKFWPLFDRASQLAPDSPLKGEAAQIKAMSGDPVGQVQTALRLVQDRVRYVYVGLDGGNYIPASADETWKRRFGDCKAKTALLLALLRELGVDAEPVLVNTVSDDGLDQHLPSPQLFDHVVVRVRIGGAQYWLDGTRLGDRYLAAVPPPPYRWALPLTVAGADLQAVPLVVSPSPDFIATIDIDARAGFDVPAKFSSEQIMRGDEGYQLKERLAALSPADAERAMKGFWSQQVDWVEPDKVSWRYDERHAALILAVTGEGKPEWSGNDESGRSLDIPGAGFVPPEKRRRAKDQDQKAPWAIEFPRFRCWATTIRLPPANKKWRWTYFAKPMNERLGGTAFWRASGLRDDVMRTVMSRHNYVREISAADAEQVNGKIAGFNNNISSVSQTTASGPKAPPGVLPFGDGVDWASDSHACLASPIASTDPVWK